MYTLVLCVTVSVLSAIAVFCPHLSPSRPNMPHRQWFNYLYARYIPTMVQERFAHVKAPPLVAAEREYFDAAVAFVDISGFTKLSEKLAVEYGDNGAEMLNKFISGYFERLIAVIVEWGGDIIKFAGDAMLVVWRNPRNVSAAIAGKMAAQHFDVEESDSHNGPRRSTKNLKNVLGSGDENLSTLVLRAVRKGWGDRCAFDRSTVTGSAVCVCNMS